MLISGLELKEEKEEEQTIIDDRLVLSDKEYNKMIESYYKDCERA